MPQIMKTHRIYQNPQQWKNNDDVHRWIGFGKSRPNRFLGVVIEKNGPESTDIKIAYAVTKMGSSYQRELEAIRIGTTYAKENINILKKTYLYLLIAKHQYKPS